MNRNLQKALRQQKKSTKPSNPQLTGLLGIPLGGQRRVEVANRNNYVYVRLRNNQSEVIQAFNNQVSPSYNLPVLVERQGNRYVVVSVDTQRYDNNWSSFAPFLPRHGNQHSFDPETGGGGDTVWVYSRQIMPLLTFPSGSVGAGNVIVAPYTLKNDDGSWKYVGNTGTQIITSHNPNTGTQAIMVLVYLDSVSGNPYLLINTGSFFQSTITGANAIVPYIPSLPNPSYIPLSAIRLVSGTSAISWDNIYDVRQWLHTTPTGTGGGGGGGGGGVDTIGFAGLDEGVFLGTGTALNVMGQRASLSLSGTMFNLTISPDPAELIGIMGWDDGAPIGTGTVVDFGDNLSVSLSGTVLRIDATAGGGGAGGNLLIYDDSAFVATGTKLSFNQNLNVYATGTSVFVEAPITTYFRVGQPTTLSNPTGEYWTVPDRVYASGSLGVFNNGHALIPGIDYEEHLWVSGTYRYLLLQPTGTYHLVNYGVPCSPQTQPPTGTAGGSDFDLQDSDAVLLQDSDSVQLLDSDG